MSMDVVIGKKGSGKSQYAVVRIIQWLRDNPEGFVITNLALYVDKLNEYVQKLYPEEDLNVCGRVFLIETKEMGHFWRYQERDGKCVCLGRFDSEAAEWKAIKHGVFHVVDEAQKNFGARQWATRGTEASEFLPEARHYAEDALIITPAAGLLDKHFRMLADRCILLDNWYKKKLRIFKAPGALAYRVYENTPPERGEENSDSGKMQIDPEGLSGCYNTAAGANTKADIGKKARGLPWWSVFVFIFAIGAGFWLAVHYIMGAIQHRMTSEVKPPALTNTGPFNPAVVVGRAMGLPSFMRPGETSADKLQPEYERDALAVVGHRERLIRAVGWSSAGKGTLIELETGYRVYGTNLVQRGDVLWMEGLGYALVGREKPHFDHIERDRETNSEPAQSKLPDNLPFGNVRLPQAQLPYVPQWIRSGSSQVGSTVR